MLRLLDWVKYLLSATSRRHPGILCLEMSRWLNLIWLPFDSILLETCLVQKFEAFIAWTAARAPASAAFVETSVHASIQTSVHTFVKVAFILY